MRKNRIILLAVVSISMVISGCSASGTKQSEETKAETTKLTEVTAPTIETEATAVTEKVVEKQEADNAAAETEKKNSTSSSTQKSYSSSSSTKTTSSSFTNKYGTATTKCAKAGCNNYIASSGDTAYCTTHSNRCLECNKYIDGDAMYCMDCITKAASDIRKDKSSSYGSGSSYSSGSSKYSSNNDTSGGYGYNSSDPYYSANDHDGDGKINDQEFQDAMNDLIDDLLADQNY